MGIITADKRVVTAGVFFLLLLAALTLTAHHLQGSPYTHSIGYNVSWQHYFGEELSNGTLFPRWLSNYYHGLGAPVFYFYAPLPFYLLAAIDIALDGSGGTLVALSIGYVVIYLLSGLAMLMFLSRHTNRFWAVGLSLLYMALPYHYIDLEIRGALGEAFAYIWIPVIMMGVCRSEKHWNTLLATALAYGLLVLSHLPSALLAGLMILIFSLCMAPKGGRFSGLLFATLVGALGILSSAFYVVPAMLMQNTIPANAWVTASGSHFLATNWLIGNPDMISGYFYKAFAYNYLLAMAVVLLAWLFRKRLKLSDAPFVSPLAMAAILMGLLSWLLMSELARPIWAHVKVLAQVQFPWRLGPVIDFCSILLLALFAPPLLQQLAARLRLSWRLEYLLLPLLVVMMAAGVMHHYAPTKRFLSVEDVPVMCPVEYRPKWLVGSELYRESDAHAALMDDIETAMGAHKESMQRWTAVVAALPAVDAERALSEGESLRLAYTDSTTNPTITASLKAPATLRVRKVYYPYWQLLDDKGSPYTLYPDPETGLLLVDLPAGEFRLQLRGHILQPEKIGFALSAVTLLAILAFWRLFGQRRFMAVNSLVGKTD